MSAAPDPNQQPPDLRPGQGKGPWKCVVVGAGSGVVQRPAVVRRGACARNPGGGTTRLQRLACRLNFVRASGPRRGASGGQTAAWPSQCGGSPGCGVSQQLNVAGGSRSGSQTCGRGPVGNAAGSRASVPASKLAEERLGGYGPVERSLDSLWSRFRALCSTRMGM